MPDSAKPSVKDGDRLIAELNARMFWLRAGLPVWTPVYEIVYWVELNRN